MKKFLKRIYNLAGLPFVTAMIIICLSIISRFSLSGRFFLVFGIVFLVLVSLSGIIFTCFGKFKFALACLVVLLAGSLFCVRTFAVYAQYDKAINAISDNSEVIGYVCEHPVTKRFAAKSVSEFHMKVVGVKTAGITDFVKVSPFTVLVKADLSQDCSSDAFCRKGDKIHVVSGMNVPTEDVSGFKYRDYLYTNGVYGIVKCSSDDVYLLDSELDLPIVDCRIFDKVLYKWRQSMIDKFRCRLSEKSFGFFMSVFLGLRNELNSDVCEDFRESGMMHLIAISGMHISVIGGFIFFIFGRIFSKSVSYLLSLGVMSLYMCLLPFQPSSQRAFIMYAVVVFFFVFGNKTGKLTGISFAAIVLCFINPYCIYNIGFQFSFLATASIILFNRQINDVLSNVIKGGKFFDKIRDNLSVTLSAFLSIFIIQIGLFGRIALFSLLTSLLIIPMFEIVFSVLFFGGILLYLTNLGLFAQIMNTVTEIFLFVVGTAGKIPMVALPKIPTVIGYLFIPMMFILFNLIFPLLCNAFSSLINNVRVYFYDKNI